MTDDARTLLSTDALPIAAVVLPRELIPAGAPAPADVEPPVRSVARTGQRLAYIVIGLAVVWPLLGLFVVPNLPAEYLDVAVIGGLVLTGLVLFGLIAFDHDRLFERRRRAGWIRAMTALGGDPQPAGEHVTAVLQRGHRRFAAELGVDETGLWCFWLRALPTEGEAVAELTLRRRSVARRFWPTGDPDFDAILAVRGPLTARTLVLDAARRRAWTALVARTDVVVDDGRLMFSLAYAPRTSLGRPIRRIIDRLCTAAASCVYRPDAVADGLETMTADEPPAVAANALRVLRSTAPGARTDAVQAGLLAADDPWRRLLAAEVAGDEDTLVAALGAAVPDIRFRAVDALIELWPLDGLAARLDLLLDHPEGAIRGTALAALGRRSLPLEAERLAQAARDADPQVGLGLLDWLGTATGPEAEAALIALIEHPAPVVVHRAADRLGRVGGPDAEMVLIELTRNRVHRRAARNALLHLRQRYPKSLGGVAVGRRRGR